MKIFLRLIGYGLRHKALVVGAYVAMALSVASGLAMPKLVGFAIDQALAPTTETGVPPLLYIAAGAILLAGALPRCLQLSAKLPRRGYLPEDRLRHPQRHLYEAPKPQLRFP